MEPHGGVIAERQQWQRVVAACGSAIALTVLAVLCIGLFSEKGGGGRGGRLAAFLMEKHYAESAIPRFSLLVTPSPAIQRLEKRESGRARWEGGKVQSDQRQQLYIPDVYMHPEGPFPRFQNLLLLCCIYGFPMHA